MHTTTTSRFVASSLGLAIATMVMSACPFEDIPPCPGQCFAHTITYELPKICKDEEGGVFPIPFTGSNGYRGRVCFNSFAVPRVHEAIDHLRAGGQLSELGADVQSAYEATVVSIQTDLHAQCTTAAAGQCTNAEQVCTGIAADLYEQLVVEQTCVLHADGTEPVALLPGEICHSIADDDPTDTASSGDHCPDTTSTSADEVDETATSSDAVSTTSTTEDTGDTTGSMVSRR